jgi:hypothetical protein
MHGLPGIFLAGAEELESSAKALETGDYMFNKSLFFKRNSMLMNENDGSLMIV